MFETIQIGIQMKSPASKDEDENPQSRYFDQKLLPIIVESGGKRRRKTRRTYGKTRRTYRKTIKALGKGKRKRRN